MPSADTVLFVLLLVVLATVAAWLRRRFAGPRYPTGDLPYFSRGYQLSKGETAFFHALRQAVPPGLMIAPKVRVSDVIGCDASAWKRGFGGRISQKHVDFVLVDARTTAFELIIELDDKSHRQHERRGRDDFVDRALAAAGIPVLRVPAAARYDPADLRTRLVPFMESVSR
jgi:hypothetical protein